MKLSMSLPEQDVAFLDRYAREHGMPSRSAAMHAAVRLLRAADLECSYEDAFAEWETTGDAGVWEAVAGDGL